MTERQLAEMMAEALEDIRDNYDCDTSEGGKHDPKRCRCCKADSALAAYKEARKEPEYRMLEIGRDYIQDGDEYRDGDGGWRPVPPIFFRMPYTRIYSPTRRSLANHLPDAGKKVADHFVDANKMPQNNPTLTTPCTPSSQEPN